MRVVTISDTHCKHKQLYVPDGEVVVHAGDFSNLGREREVRSFLKWFDELPHLYKIFIAGNHDRTFERDPEFKREVLADFPELIYLEDQEVVIDGIKFYGSPWQPEFGTDWAFNLPRGEALAEKWAAIPGDTDVLITHGPPYGQNDRVLRTNPDGRRQVGCEDLIRRLEEIDVKYVVSGHIHESSGVSRKAGVTYINASCVTVYHELLSSIPFSFDI